MLLKVKRNGRIWKGSKKREEVLDVFYGENCEKKLPRGFCHGAFKKIIKEPLAIGEELMIRLEILDKEKEEEDRYEPDSQAEPPLGIRRNGYGRGGHRHG